MGKINLGMVRILALVLVLALTAVVAVPVSANVSLSASATPPAALHTVQGKVTDISNSSTSFTIQTGNQQSLSITTNSSTQFYLVNTGKAQSYVNGIVNRDNQQNQKNGKAVPPRANALKNAHIPANWRDNLGWLETFDKKAQFSDIQVGDRIIARITNDSSNLAKQVLIIKAPVNKTVKGTVVSATANTITLTPNDSTSTLPLNVVAQTRIALTGTAVIQAGQTIVAVYNSTNNNALTVNIQAAQP